MLSGEWAFSSLVTQRIPSFLQGPGGKEWKTVEEFTRARARYESMRQTGQWERRSRPVPTWADPRYTQYWAHTLCYVLPLCLTAPW